MHSRFAVALFGILVASALRGYAETHYVWTNSPSPTAPFTNWATASLTVQAAVDLAQDGDTVVVTDGVYMATTFTDEVYGLWSYFEVTNGIALASCNGPDRTAIDFPRGHMLLDHSNAVVRGFRLGGRDGSQWGSGVHLQAGTLVNCLITENLAQDGAGVHILTNGYGVIQQCTVVSNSGRGGRGAGILCEGTGLIENSLIAWNFGDYYVFRGGGVYNEGSLVIRNSTVAYNIVLPYRYYDCNSFYPLGSDGPGLYSTGPLVVENCIIWSNSNPLWFQLEVMSEQYVVDASNTVFSHVCSYPLPPGESNFATNPLFDPLSDLQSVPLPWSPCVDSGSTNAWTPGSQDLAGCARVYDGRVDIGAYEVQPGPLACWFSTDPAGMFSDQSIAFHATVEGLDQAGLLFCWDFDGDGSEDLRTNMPDAYHVYEAPTTVTARLTVTNAAGESHTATASVRTGPRQVFVSPSGLNVSPFTNWVTAATSVQAAADVCVDGSMILVTDGTYQITSTIILSNAVYLTSVNGPTSTVLAGDGLVLCLRLNSSGATAEGLTIRNGNGGVWLEPGTTLRGCDVRSNELHIAVQWPPRIRGAGVYCRGGTVDRCRIEGNQAILKPAPYECCALPEGCGVYCEEGGRIVGCLILHNIATNGCGPSRGGGVFCAGGSVVANCTIVSNSAGTEAGGIYCAGGNTIVNSIISGNTAPSNSNWFDAEGTTFFESSCSTPALSGSGNLAIDPLFQNPSVGDFSLGAGSPCRNAGTNLGWLALTDIAGNPRITSGTVDIGAFEMAGLLCRFTSDRRQAYPDETVEFAGRVDGTNVQPVYFAWDFDGDGLADPAYTGLETVRRTFTCGVYSVSLWVSNSANETAEWHETSVLKVGPRHGYVAASGSHSFPFDSWATASTNIRIAVDACVDGSVVTVTSGVHVLDAEVFVPDAITIEGTGGPENTVVDGNGHRAFRVANTGAVLRGMTVRNALVNQANGGAVYLDGGTVEHCILRDNMAKTFAWQCARSAMCFKRAYGAAAYCSNAIIRNCLIMENDADIYSEPEGHVVAGEEASAIYFAGGLVENCTIAGNRGWNAVVAVAPGEFRNTIIWLNTRDLRLDAAASFAHCCLSTSVAGSANTTNDPRFANPTNILGVPHASVTADYALMSNSPCVDTGVNAAWMSGATDVAGSPRLAHGAVDMGALEYGGEFQPDHDGDGLTSAEETANYGSNPFLRDSDGDRMDDRTEAICGTRPCDAGSYLKVASCTPSPSGLQVRWRTVYGKGYWIERNAHFPSGAWEKVWPDAIYELNEFPEGEETVLDPAAPDGAVYRTRMAE